MARITRSMTKWTSADANPSTVEKKKSDRLSGRKPTYSHDVITFTDRYYDRKNGPRQTAKTTHGSSRFRLLELPTEIMRMLVDYLNLTERQGIDALISLRRSCRMLNTLLKPLNLQSAILPFLDPIPRRYLRALRLSTTQDAQRLILYKEAVDQYMDGAVSSYMETEDESMLSESDIPAEGWRGILDAGFLLRAKVFGFQTVATDFDCSVVQSLAPAEILVLMYSTLIFQGCYDTAVRTPADYWYNAWHYLRRLRCIFLMWGTHGAVEMFLGRKGMNPRFPELRCSREEMLKNFAIPAAREYERVMGDQEPEKQLRAMITNNMQAWHSAGGLTTDTVFAGHGDSVEGAATLKKCLERWCSVLDPDKLPWNFEN